MLDSDVIGFLEEAGVGMLCTRNADNQPAASEYFWLEVTPDHVCGFVPEFLGRHLPANTANNDDAAIVSSRTMGDHRSVQVKGKIVACDGPAPLEPGGISELYLNALRYYPEQVRDQMRPMLDQMIAGPGYRIEVAITEVYDQTPGPKAGSRIGASA